MENLHESMLRTMRKESLMGKNPRGFHSHDIHRAAEELRHENKGSHDPIYQDSNKNK